MQALSCYDEIVHRFPDLAITEYARIHRAIFLYQTGNASRAILELEDEEVNLRGFAEVCPVPVSAKWSVGGFGVMWKPTWTYGVLYTIHGCF